MEFTITPDSDRKYNRAEFEQISAWISDRGFVARQALRDMQSQGGLLIIEMYDGSELVGIGTAETGDIIKILNVATKRQGYGWAMMREFAKCAVRADCLIELMSSDDALGFYEKLGFEIEGFPGENLGVPCWWPWEQIEQFASSAGCDDCF